MAVAIDSYKQATMGKKEIKVNLDMEHFLSPDVWVAAVLLMLLNQPNSFTAVEESKHTSLDFVEIFAFLTNWLTSHLWTPEGSRYDFCREIPDIYIYILYRVQGFYRNNLAVTTKHFAPYQTFSLCHTHSYSYSASPKYSCKILVAHRHIVRQTNLKSHNWHFRSNALRGGKHM